MKELARALPYVAFWVGFFTFLIVAVIHSP